MPVPSSSSVVSPRWPLAIMVGLFSLGLAACQPEGVGAQASSEPSEPRLVWVDPVLAPPAKRLSYPGTIRPRSDAPLAFRVGGKVLERSVDVGDRVGRGDVVARLDTSDLDATVNADRARERAAKAEAERTADELMRIEALKKKGHVSQAALDRADAAADAAAETLKAAKERRRISENQRDYAVLRANADGIVTAALVEPGEVVALGQPVVRLARSDSREAVVAIPEAHIADIAGAEASVTLWALPDQRFSARLRELSPQADASARTFTARFSLTGADDVVRLGMTATVHLSPDRTLDGVAVPLSAVWYRQDAAHVWHAEPGDTQVRAIPVQVQQVSAEQAVVVGDLSIGMHVVSLGVHRLDEDLLLRVERRAPSGTLVVGALQ